MVSPMKEKEVKRLSIVKQAKAKVVALERELVQSRNELEEARDRATETLEKDATQSRSRISDLENSLQASRNELLLARRDVVKLEEDIRQCQARISTLENDLEERSVEIERLLEERSALSQRFDFRYNCEALFVSGRVEEAAQEFLRLLETFGTNDVMPEWVIDLQKRFVDNLVALADQALTSESHARAIALYSSALSLKPTTPVDILGKRSELRASQGLWSEALADADEMIKLDPLLPKGYQRKCEALRGLQDAPS